MSTFNRHCLYQGFVQSPFGVDDAWGVQEDQLGHRQVDDAQEAKAGGLWLGGDDGQLAAHQPVHPSGLPVLG
jgi:hypothetical protein